MSLRLPKKGTDDAELDVTAFLNLMIVLVPVLLMSMSFAKTTVLELRLPELTGGMSASEISQAKLEVVMTPEGFQVFFPENTLVKEIPKKMAKPNVPVSGDAPAEPAQPVYDYETLSLVLQAVKEQRVDKKDVVIKLNKSIAYKDLVTTMDTVKSYKTVVVASLAEIELFPEISLGDIE